MLKRLPAILTIAAMAATLSFAQVKEGIDLSGQAATPNENDFDPPTSFGASLPLNGSFYLNPASRAFFASGNGSVLDEGSNFNVSGFSAPNFLAWNCNATNFDGTTPQLPELIVFTGGPVTTVSVKIGSAGDAGEVGGIAALNAAFQPIDVDQVTLGPALQEVTTNAPGTTAVAIFGPCVMVADDLQFN